MNATALPRSRWSIHCYYRPLVMVATGIVLVSVFWFVSRYPQLLGKAEHVGQALPSMAFGSELIHVAENAPVGRRILRSAGNWLHTIQVALTLAVCLGASLP